MVDMKYPWYSVSTKFFNGIFYTPMNEGIFYTLEEAVDRYNSIELGDKVFGVYLHEFHEDCAKEVISKEKKLNLPTQETMGRVKYRRKGAKNAEDKV